MKKVYTYILATAAWFSSCSMPARLQSDRTADLSALPGSTNSNTLSEITGRCVLWLGTLKLMTLAYVSRSASSVNISLVDEYGIPLLEIGTDSEDVVINRIFPPLNEYFAWHLGVGIYSWAIIVDKTYPGHGVFKAKTAGGYTMIVIAGDNGIDSMQIGMKNRINYTGSFSGDLFFFRTEEGDTLFSFSTATGE